MSPADKAKPLIPYLRQSRAKEKTISIEEQWRDIRAWAKREGVKLAEGVIEQGVSGSKHWKKRELGAAVEACHRGEASGIIVAYQSRLSRERGLATAEVWEEFEKAGLRLVCVYENIDTARDDDQEFNFGIQALIARQEWKRHARNWSKGKHAAWERSAYVSYPPPGYDRDEGARLVPNGAAGAIRRAFELRASEPRAKWLEVGAVLEGAGILTKFGSAEWIPISLRGVIRNEVYTGLHRCTCGCGESVIRPEWEIVPGWLWRKAQVEAGVKPATVSRGAGHALGQGLVRCEKCGAGLERSNGNLRCPARGTGHASIMFETALDWVLLEVANYIGCMIKDDGKDDERVQAEQAVSDARAALTEVEEMLGMAAPAGSKQRLALEEAEDRLAGIGQPDGELDWGRVLTPLGIKEHILSLPIADQRRAIRSVVERVILLKTKGTDAERAQVRAGSRHPAASRLRIEFVDGYVSPPSYLPPDIADAVETDGSSPSESEQLV